jgi:hypothetical protein
MTGGTEGNYKKLQLGQPGSGPVFNYGTSRYEALALTILPQQLVGQVLNKWWLLVVVVVVGDGGVWWWWLVVFGVGGGWCRCSVVVVGG